MILRVYLLEPQAAEMITCKQYLEVVIIHLIYRCQRSNLSKQRYSISKHFAVKEDSQESNHSIANVVIPEKVGRL